MEILKPRESYFDQVFCIPSPSPSGKNFHLYKRLLPDEVIQW